MPFSRPPFTGFPFDSDDAHFRSELEDIAHRHPEFAEHLNPAAHSRRTNADRFRSPDPFADYRSPSGRQWPFSSRFQQFPFPFTSDFDEDPLIQQRQYQSQAANERPPEKQEEKVNEKPPQAPQKPAEERSRRNIQQSNTVDLGQRQETVDDNSRNQRSMSAPPENRNTSSKRFVSSINIPNLSQPTGDSSMGGRMSQPETPPQQQQQQPQNKPTERIIPIHIEGRDVPIIPKNVNISGAAPQPERIFTGGRQMPEPERIFGQRPSTFTQFVNKDPDVERQREEQAKQQQEYQRQQQEYQKQQQQEYQKQQQQQEFQKQQQQEAQKPTPPPEQKPTPLDLILNIQKDVSKLMEDVAKFEGKPKDKQYLYLDEMLTRNMLKLDNIETEGKDAIRQARKEAIKCIEQCIQVLESKALANQANKEEKMEVEPEQKPAEGEPKTEAMQVETEPPKEEAKPENKEEKPAAEEAKKEEGGDEKNKPAADEKKEEDDTNAPAAVKVEEPAAEDKKEEVKEEKSEPSHEESKPEEKEKDKKKGKKKSESK